MTFSTSLLRKGSRLSARNLKLTPSSTNNSRAIVTPAISALPFSCSRDDGDTWHQNSRSKKYSTYARKKFEEPLVSINAKVRSREYSVTTKSESATLALGLGAIAATAKAGQYAVTAFQDWKKNQPEEPSSNENATSGDETRTDAGTGGSATGSSDGGEKKNIFSDFFSVGSKYYEGGFEEKMNTREAALILGVRESSTKKRIKEAHRKLLILNHPDTGGSTYLSGKLNEAKDLLLKSKGR